MIRPMTCICMLMAAGSGLYLYQAKHQGYMLERTIAQVQHTTEDARGRIGVLRAEYALLNDPSRLQELVHQHLPLLSSLMPAQFTTLAEMDQRLPPIGARPVAAPVMQEPMATSSVLDFPPLHAPAPAQSPAPSSLPAPAAPKAPTAIAATTSPAPGTAAPVASAAAANPAPAAEPAPAAAPAPIRARRRVLTASTTPTAPRRVSTDPLAIPASSASVYNGAPPISPAVASVPVPSALGMARMLTTSPAVSR